MSSWWSPPVFPRGSELPHWNQGKVTASNSTSARMSQFCCFFSLSNESLLWLVPWVTETWPWQTSCRRLAVCCIQLIVLCGSDIHSVTGQHESDQVQEDFTLKTEGLPFATAMINIRCWVHDANLSAHSLSVTGRASSEQWLESNDADEIFQSETVTSNQHSSEHCYWVMDTKLHLTDTNLT